MKQITPYLLCLLLLFTACKKDTSKTNSSTETVTATEGTTPDTEIVQTAKEAFVFGMPLVLMDITRAKMIDATNNPNAAAVNTFEHKSKFPDAAFRDVVRANADTYYSTASLDLKAEPIILSVPNTHGRYYMMPMLDAYTNVFASPGTRTTGNEAHNFLITGPGWNGSVPAGMEQIKAPTNLVWLIGRTQVNSKADGDKVVVPLQKQYKLTPLSTWGKPYTPPAAKADPTVQKASPNEIIEAMPVEDFFNYMNKLLAVSPPASADAPVLEKFAKIGIGPGKKFDMAALSPEAQKAIKNIPKEVTDGFIENIKKVDKVVNGWKPLSKNIGTYGTNYTERAFVAYVGLGANLPEDAAYPSASFDADGKALNGSNKYVLHFDKGKTPPANAFWSLTMYDAKGYMVPNPINRNAIGDRSNLKKNADGSVDIYFQNDSPGKDKESNWLPAPKGEFNLILRIYWPKEEMLNGSWQAPGIKKVN